MFVYIGASIFSVMQQVTNFSDTEQHITKILMIILDLFNSLFIYFQLIYYGTVQTDVEVQVRLVPQFKVKKDKGLKKSIF